MLLEQNMSKQRIFPKTIEYDVAEAMYRIHQTGPAHLKTLSNDESEKKKVKRNHLNCLLNCFSPPFYTNKSNGFYLSNN